MKKMNYQLRNLGNKLKKLEEDTCQKINYIKNKRSLLERKLREWEQGEQERKRFKRDIENFINSISQDYFSESEYVTETELDPNSDSETELDPNSDSETRLCPNSDSETRLGPNSDSETRLGPKNGTEPNLENGAEPEPRSVSKPRKVYYVPNHKNARVHLFGDCSSMFRGDYNKEIRTTILSDALEHRTCKVCIQKYSVNVPV